jgi:transposase InsO family protein
VPVLASAASTVGLTYSLWRPQMATYLMRQGIEERDYTEEIPQWQKLVSLVQADAKAEEQSAIALLLGGVAHAASAKPDPASKAADALQQSATETAKKQVSALITRARKAYGFLFAALPTDLRLLVADIPQGYAFGIWSFLEKKYRNTEQDNVAALWKEFVNLSQTADESFDEYKARVDSVVELLKHAKENPPAGLYCTIVLWKLQARYDTAILTLRAGDKLKKPDAIVWPEIVNYINQYERSQLGLNDSDEAVIERSMAARSSHTSSATANKSFKNDIQCWNCKQMGHYQSECKQPIHRHTPGSGAGSGGSASAGATNPKGSGWNHHKAKGGHAAQRNKRTTSEPAEQRAHMARQYRHGDDANRFSTLKAFDSDEEDREAARTQGASSADPTARANALLGLETDSDDEDDGEPAAVTYAAVAKGVRPTSAPKHPAARVINTKSQADSLDKRLKTTAKAVDSAATVNTTCNLKSLRNIHRCRVPMPIRMADGSVISAAYKGDLRLRLPVSGSSGQFINITIRNVYYHERFDANLLSWGCMRKHGWEMHSNRSGTYLITPGGKRIDASTKGKLTIIETVEPSSDSEGDASSRDPTERVYALGGVVCATARELVQLHRRLGHVSWARLIQMCTAGTSVGIGDIRNMPKPELDKAEQAVKLCRACAEAKAHRKPVGSGGRGLERGSSAGEVIHMDTFYVVRRNATTGKKETSYCLLGADGFTEFVLHCIESRLGDLPEAAIEMVEHSQTLTGRYPRLIISDLGSEFNNRTFSSYCRNKGVRHQMTPARAKELNGIAEKTNDTVKNHARAMLRGAGMGTEFGWTFALSHQVFVWNRTHVGRFTGVTPYQTMTGREPSVMNLGEFGCDAYVHQHRSQRDTTFASKAEPAIYLGHSTKHNCPTLYLIRSGKTVHSKDVHFREGSFEHLRAVQEGREDTFSSASLREIYTRSLEEPQDWQDDDFGLSELSLGAADAPESEPAGASRSAANAGPDEVLEQPHYKIKSIIDERTVNGVKQYHCKWVGYPSPSWEPAETIAADAPRIVRDYETFLDQRKQAVVTRSRTKPDAVTGNRTSEVVSNSVVAPAARPAAAPLTNARTQSASAASTSTSGSGAPPTPVPSTVTTRSSLAPMSSTSSTAAAQGTAGAVNSRRSGVVALPLPNKPQQNSTGPQQLQLVPLPIQKPVTMNQREPHDRKSIQEAMASTQRRYLEEEENESSGNYSDSELESDSEDDRKRSSSTRMAAVFAARCL